MKEGANNGKQKISSSYAYAMEVLPSSMAVSIPNSRVTEASFFLTDFPFVVLPRGSDGPHATSWEGERGTRHGHRD